MNKLWIKLSAILLFTVLFSAIPSAQEKGEGENGAERAGKVVLLPIQGPIDKGLMILCRRAFREVEKLKPDAVIVGITTDGGGLVQTEEIIAWMRSVDVPIYSYVNIFGTNKSGKRGPRALSAGAIISFGTEKIFMAPGSRIGSAMPIMVSGGQVQELPEDVQEKFLSNTRALVQGLAQENGHLEDLALCMVDPEHELKIGDRVICEKGEILNLNAEEAIEVIPPRAKPLLAASIEPDLEAVLKKLGLDDAEIIRIQLQPAEKLARWIVGIGPVLFMLGIIGIFIEMKTPGLGIPGLTGACMLAVYFFGHYVAGLAGMEDIALVTVGLILLVLEIFVIPGFGVAGILGLLCIGAGTILGMIPYIPEIPSDLPNWSAPGLGDYLEGALIRFLIIVCGTVIGGYLLAKILPKTGPYRQLVLDTSLTAEAGYTSGDTHYRDLIGEVGAAQTDLHPSGIVELGDERLDVVTRGDLIAKGQQVRIAEVHGSRIIVEPVA
ncbi:MAG: NfeD family protein [Lentisphaeria bacterium]